MDLHTLYRSVTDLGGVDSVINKKQFVIACEPFNFPPSFTNKSYVIKKLYFNALYHYEQVYFRRLSGQPVHNTNVNTQAMMMSPSSQLPPPNHSGSTSSDRSLKRPRMEGGCESPRPINAPKVNHPSNVVQGPPTNLSQGDRFNGIIDYQGPTGYVVTVTVMGQRFQCAMVNRTVAESSQVATLFPSSSILHPLQEMDSGLRLGGGHGNVCRKARPAPAPVKSAFQFFLEGMDKDLIFSFAYEQLPEGSDPNTEISNELYMSAAHQLFEGLGKDKQSFEYLAENDRQRYAAELKESQSVDMQREECDFATPSSIRHSAQPRAHVTPTRVMTVALPYGQFDPGYMPFGPPSRQIDTHFDDKVGPRVMSNTSGACLGGSIAHDDDDSRCLEHVLGGQVAPEDDEMDLAIELCADVDLKGHVDFFGGVAQVAAVTGGVAGSGVVSKGSSLLMGGGSTDKSLMADGISSACTTATREEKALI